MVSTAVLNLGFGIIIPALPVLSQELGLGASGMGLIMGVPALARILSNLPAGVLADKVGRVPCMAWGTLLSAFGVLGTGIASSLTVMLPIRFLMGVGSAHSSASSATYLVDLTEHPRLRPHRGLFMGLQGGLVAGAFVLGPVIGGLLTELHSAQAAYCTVAALNVLSAAMYAALPEVSSAGGAGAAASVAAAGAPRGHPGAASAGLNAKVVLDSLRHSRLLFSEAAGHWRALLRDPNQQGLFAANSVLFLNYAAAVTLIPLRAFDLFGMSPSELGALMSATSVVGVVAAPVAGRLGDRYGRLALVKPAMMTIAVGGLSVGLANDWSHFLASYFLWCGGKSLLNPSLTAYAADIAPKGRTGSALALSRQSTDLVFFAGPPVLGVLHDFGCGALPCTAAATTLGVVLVVRAREVVQPGRRQAPPGAPPGAT